MLSDHRQLLLDQDTVMKDVNPLAPKCLNAAVEMCGTKIL